MKAFFLILVSMFISSYALGQKVKPIEVRPLFENEQITDRHKRAFLELMEILPKEGELYTEEAEQRAAPYLLVLFALTEKDLEGLDFSPFAALSRGIINHEPYNYFASMHFDDIQHPRLKLLWATILFRKILTKDVVEYMQQAFKSPAQIKVLKEILGSQFDEYARLVKGFSPSQKPRKVEAAQK